MAVTLKIVEKVLHFSKFATGSVYSHCTAKACGHKVALDDQVSGHFWLNGFIVLDQTVSY